MALRLYVPTFLNQIKVDSTLSSEGVGLNPMAGLDPIRPPSSIVQVGLSSFRVVKKTRSIAMKNAVRNV